MVKITLTPELEQLITAKAQRDGSTPEQIALEILSRELLPTPPAPSEASLADFLGEFVGCLDSGEVVPGGAQMSENIGAKFAEGMQDKRQSGHL